jgi:hypothetical protein
VKKALLLLAVLTVTGVAQGASPSLPRPLFTTSPALMDVTAYGTTTALAIAGNNGRCWVGFFQLAASARPTLLKRPSPCDPDTEQVVSNVWLSRTTIAAFTYDSPSPHGEDWAYFVGPRPAGPLHQVGVSWGWNDSDPPFGFGCRRVVVAGDGVIASAKLPNRLGYENGLDQPKPACPAGPTTTVELAGAAVPRLVAPGSWEPLATDGQRVLLAALDANGQRIGTVRLVDLRGHDLARPALDPALVKSASAVWLTPEGIVVDTARRVHAPGWQVATAGAVTVGEGRVVYVRGRMLRVRRIRGGPDRLLAALPAGDTELAAGEYGVSITVGNGDRVALYRLPWRTIDRTLTR